MTENVIEFELAQIEDRIPSYSAEAQRDMRWLTRELRKVYNLGVRDAGPPTPAIHDALTGLLSGGGYGVRFAAARSRAARYKKIFAVMTIDLALAKTAPAGTLSDQEAEEILKQIAGRLTSVARATDTLARVDREKFAMILEELTLPEHAERVKQKVEAALAEPILLQERSLRAHVNVSLQFYPSAQPVDAKLN